MTAIKKNNNIIAKKLIDEGIVINSREMNDNPLVSAIRFFKCLSCRGTYEKLQGFDSSLFKRICKKL